jgi:putative ABC transport system permease protein
LGHERVVVLGDALWRRRFAADPAIVGRDIRIDDEGYRVIGVMPPKFVFPMTSELWTPLALKPAESNSRDSQYLSVIGLLKPGLTVSRPKPRPRPSHRGWRANTPTPTSSAASFRWPPTSI